MKAMKLTADQDEKKQLKAQCGEMMNIADRIKKSTEWELVIKECAPPDTKAAIEQRATRVPKSSSASDGASMISGMSSVFSKPTLQSEAALYMAKQVHHDDTTLLEDLYKPKYFPTMECKLNSLADTLTTDDAVPTNQQAQSPRISPNATLEYRSVDSPVGSTLQRNDPTGLLASSLPSTAPYSQIHRLREPLSTRKRSKKEDIILLKASMVNGFKCPPWKENPSSSEFELQAGAEPFV